MNRAERVPRAPSTTLPSPTEIRGPGSGSSSMMRPVPTARPSTAPTGSCRRTRRFSFGSTVRVAADAHRDGRAGDTRPAGIVTDARLADVVGRRGRGAVLGGERDRHGRRRRTRQRHRELRAPASPTRPRPPRRRRSTPSGTPIPTRASDERCGRGVQISPTRDDADVARTRRTAAADRHRAHRPGPVAVSAQRPAICGRTAARRDARRREWSAPVTSMNAGSADGRRSRDRVADRRSVRRRSRPARRESGA